MYICMYVLTCMYVCAYIHTYIYTYIIHTYSIYLYMYVGVHGVMVGRSIVNYPFHWRTLDSELYNCPDPGNSSYLTSSLAICSTYV